MSMMYVRNLIDLHLKYYTDLHDVDEDLTSIVRLGGGQSSGGGVSVGITKRAMSEPHTFISNDVASSNMQRFEHQHTYI